jgi:ligand-binding SRPBCC domain-containing protein
MTTIVVETRTKAPVDLCFDLARDVDAHLRSSDFTGERAIAGKTSGLLNLGDSVTFEAVHFGIRQRLKSKIVEYDRPVRFIDEMMKGPFASLRHVHEFFIDNDGTLMRDTLTWRSPLGFLGIIADKLLVEKHMRNFIIRKQADLKRDAEETEAAGVHE